MMRSAIELFPVWGYPSRFFFSRSSTCGSHTPGRCTRSVPGQSATGAPQRAGASAIRRPLGSGFDDLAQLALQDLADRADRELRHQHQPLGQLEGGDLLLA